MNLKSNFSDVGSFAIKTLVLDIAMLGLAGLISSYLLSFGIILFCLGAIVGGVGALRGGPASIDSLYTRVILQRWHRPFNQTSDQRTYIIEHSVPTYSFENVMALAGLIAIVLGIVLIIASR